MVRMRNLAIALSVGFLGAAGCSSSPAAGSGQIQLTWSLQDQATMAAISCAAGEHVDVTAGGITDSFNCADMSGITGAIPSGDYAVTFDLVLNGTVESTVTMSNPPVPVRNASVTDVGHILFIVANGPPPPGQVDISWEIRVGSVGGPTGTCAANETVTFDFGGGVTFANLPCANMTATLTQIPAGTYSVNASLLMGATVESTGTIQGLTIPSGGAGQAQHVIFVVAMNHR